jgi:hypothetical protein
MHRYVCVCKHAVCAALARIADETMNARACAVRRLRKYRPGHHRPVRVRRRAEVAPPERSRHASAPRIRRLVCDAILAPRCILSPLSKAIVRARLMHRISVKVLPLMDADVSASSVFIAHCVLTPDAPLRPGHKVTCSSHLPCLEPAACIHYRNRAPRPLIRHDLAPVNPTRRSRP